MFCGCLAGRPYPWTTRETPLSPYVLTLRIPVMCRVHASFRRMLRHKLPPENSYVVNCLSFHTLSLSITQPLQLNPTINTGYKRLNKITIKFVTELNPTKHIVVNYNFTSTNINVEKFNNKIYTLFNLSIINYKIMIFVSHQMIIALNCYLCFLLQYKLQ